MRAMARQRHERYGSMQELVDALEALLSELVAHDAAAPRPPGEPAAADARSEGLATRTSRRERASTPPTAPASWRVRGSLALAGTLVAAAMALWLALGGAVQSPGATGAQATAGPPAAPATPVAAAATPEIGRDRQADPIPAAVSAGSDTLLPERPASDARPATPGRFGSGWVYLGNHAGGQWDKRHFDGWSGELPARGAQIRPRGRSFVRSAQPDAEGVLGRVQATIGREHAVEVLDVVRWLGGSYVWARVRPAW
jgi:hypothetical protein